MNPQQDPRELLSALDDLAVRIASLLSFESEPVTQAHLCSLTHRSGKTVSRSLHILEQYQVCVHSAEGWSNTARADLLYAHHPGIVSSQEIQAPVDQAAHKRRKISTSSPLTTSSTSSRSLTNLKPEKNLLLPELELEPETEQESRPDPKEKPKLRPEKSKEFQECRQAALAAGIEEPKASNLARLPHVSVELIEYHVATVLQENQKIGLGIYRIEHNWPIKERKEPKRSQDFYERQRYVTGKYAEYINH